MLDEDKLFALYIAISLLIGFLIGITLRPKPRTMEVEEVPKKVYTKALVSFVDKKLCDYEFREYEDRIEVKVLRCFTINKNLIFQLANKFLT